MKHVSFYAFLLLILLSTRVKAQQIHLGLTTSYNATFVLDKGLSEDPRYSSTYTYNFAPIGFNFGVEFGRKFGLSLESIMSKQGQIYEIIDVADQVRGQRKIDLSYVHLPLLMKFMSGGDGAVRSNFNLGPQLSILTKAVESVQAGGGTFTIPEGMDFESIQNDFPTAVNNGDGSYSIPEGSPSAKDIFTKEANNFKNAEFQIAAAFGLDIDLSKHLFLSTQVRANYSLTDMRNGDVLESIKQGNAGDIFGQRANMLIGVQLGVHYTFGITRSFKGRE